MDAWNEPVAFDLSRAVSLRPNDEHSPAALRQMSRLDEETHQQLVDLARLEGAPIQDVTDRAVAAYRLQQLWAEANVDYAALRDDPAASEPKTITVRRCMRTRCSY